MTTAYSYVRFSTKKQIAGDSLRRQVDESTAYAKKQGWQLDNTLNLRDLGVSAFKGKHRNSGHLRTFLSKIEDGTVKPGSWLIIEALDRLTRQEITEAMALFLQIINAGVGIVTLVDGQQYSKDLVNQNQGIIFLAIGVLIGAHEYSAKLSYRVKQAKANALEDARNGDKTAIHGKPPYWVFNDNGKYALHPERAKIVREMIAMAMDGVGMLGIANRLTARGVPTHSGKKVWNDTSIFKMLHSRTLMGEFQPVTNRTIKQNPIPGYYPALLAETEFYELQGVLEQRKQAIKGRHGNMTNILGNVLTDGDDGSRMQIVMRSNKMRKTFINITSINGVKNRSIQHSMPYHALERAFLEFVSEIELGKPHNEQGEILALAGQRVEKQTRLAKLQSVLESGELADIATVAKAAGRIEAEIAELDRQIEGERVKQHAPTATIDDVNDLAKLLKNAADKGEVRRKIKMAISQVVKVARIWIRGNTVRRACVVEVAFFDGTVRLFGLRTERNKPAVLVGIPKNVAQPKVPNLLQIILNGDYAKLQSPLVEMILSGDKQQRISVIGQNVHTVMKALKPMTESK